MLKSRSMQPSHTHSSGQVEKLLKTGIFITLLVFILELCGGIWAGSLSLLSDSGHMFIDLWALVLSLLAISLARRPANDRQTFGLHRMEVMAALVNGVLVLLIAFGILYAAVKRFSNPPEVHGTTVLIVGGIGLLCNLLLAGMLHKKAEGDLNLQGALLLILEEINRVEGVVSVHDLHIWSICSHMKSLSGHVLIDPGHLPKQDRLLEGIHRGLRERFGITHTTIQVEAKGWPGVEVQY
jgi:Co/Zn/Cd efflux system component